MRKNIYQFSERIAYIKASHSPWLVDRTVFDCEPRILHALERRLEVINFN